MTKKQFLFELNNAVKCPTVKVIPSERIRFQSTDYGDMCPLTLVCAYSTGHVFGVNQWEEAAAELGLRYDVAKRVQTAADRHFIPIDRKEEGAVKGIYLSMLRIINKAR